MTTFQRPSNAFERPFERTFDRFDVTFERTFERPSFAYERPTNALCVHPPITPLAIVSIVGSPLGSPDGTSLSRAVVLEREPDRIAPRESADRPEGLTPADSIGAWP